MLKFKTFVNKYYFTLVFTTILALFSLSVTELYSRNVALYILMSVIIILSTTAIEIILNKNNPTKEKAKKMLFTMIPINIIVYTVFLLFIFN
ncbi:hypothetical protein E2E07_11705 [Staphylococcus pseudintermedius]|nr:hypothetical protein [Staphylococcus pseudintermedius]EGQ4354579.1 hypothetical protein [Staphylococcus pseudintermedius]